MRFGSVRMGWVGYGEVLSENLWSGLVRNGRAGFGVVGCGFFNGAWPRLAWRGEVRFGEALLKSLR